MSSLKVARTLTRYDESPIGLRTEMFEEHGGFLAAVDVVGAAAEEELNLLLSLKRKSIRRFVSTEKAPTRAFSWLIVPTNALTFKTLSRHYAKQAQPTVSRCEIGTPTQRS